MITVFKSPQIGSIKLVVHKNLHNLLKFIQQTRFFHSYPSSLLPSQLAHPEEQQSKICVKEFIKRGLQKKNPTRKISIKAQTQHSFAKKNKVLTRKNIYNHHAFPPWSHPNGRIIRGDRFTSSQPYLHFPVIFHSLTPLLRCGMSCSYVLNF